MTALQILGADGFFDLLFNRTPPLSRARQVQVLAAYIELWAYGTSLLSHASANLAAMSTSIPAVQYLANDTNEAKVKDFFPDISKILESKGIDAYFSGEPRSTQTFETNVFNIGFKFANPVDTAAEYREVSQKPKNTYDTFLLRRR
ncbi:MAG: hypothetical protein HY351_04580 [Candidatus Omnitrophica bacterium]|nr:hypothetical protein [Candidatus Omnitrophota bacterium]